MTRYQKLYARCHRLAKAERPEMNTRRVVKNTLVLYFRMLIVMAVGLFTSRVQLQALGVDNFGLYQVAMATVGMFAFLNGALGMASSRFLTVEMGRGTIGSLKKVFSTILGLHFGMAIFVVILLESIGLYVLKTKLNISPDRLFAVMWAYQCGVISTFLNVTQAPYIGILIAHERMKAFAYMCFYDVGAKLLIVYLLLISPFDRLIVFATLILFVSFTSIAIYRIYCIRHFSEARFRWRFDRRLLKPIASFLGWQLLSQLVFLAVTQMVSLLNQRYFGPAVVAASAIGASAYNHVNGFINNFKVAAEPQVVKLFAAKEFDKSKDLLIVTVHYSAFLLLIMGIPIWLYAPEILHLWLGDTVPPYAALFLRLILAGAFFANFDYSMFTVIYADGRMKYNTICDLIFYPATFAMIWISIKLWHCPVTTAIGQGCMSVVLALAVKPFLLRFMAGYKLGDFCRMFIPSFTAFLLCGCLDYSFYVISPRSGLLVLMNCALLGGANVLLIFSFVASAEVQDQLLKLTTKFGPIGLRASEYGKWYFANVRRFRRHIGLSRLLGDRDEIEA